MEGPSLRLKRRAVFLQGNRGTLRAVHRRPRQRHARLPSPPSLPLELPALLLAPSSRQVPVTAEAPSQGLASVRGRSGEVPRSACPGSGFRPRHSELRTPSCTARRGLARIPRPPPLGGRESCDPGRRTSAARGVDAQGVAPQGPRTGHDLRLRCVEEGPLAGVPPRAHAHGQRAQRRYEDRLTDLGLALLERPRRRRALRGARIEVFFSKIEPLARSCALG